MNMKYITTTLHRRTLRRTLMLMLVVALSAAMLPTAAFASGYGNQGRAYDPGPRQQRGQHRPAQDNYDKHENKGQHNNNYDKHDNRGNHDRDNHGRHNQHSDRCDATYRVQRGDSLSQIAEHYGVSVHALAKANGIKNPNRIYKGQVLCIPC
jgi:nucleoid-associated protein YgaU